MGELADKTWPPCSYGWEKTRKNLNALLEEHRRITKVNHLDNMKDEVSVMKLLHT